MGELQGAPLSSLEPASSIPQRSTETPTSTLTIMVPVARGPTSQVAREAVGCHPRAFARKSDAALYELSIPAGSNKEATFSIKGEEGHALLHLEPASRGLKKGAGTSESNARGPLDCNDLRFVRTHY